MYETEQRETKLRSFGHIQRMGEGRIPGVAEMGPFGKRHRGCSWDRRKDGVRQDQENRGVEWELLLQEDSR